MWKGCIQEIGRRECKVTLRVLWKHKDSGDSDYMMKRLYMMHPDLLLNLPTACLNTPTLFYELNWFTENDFMSYVQLLVLFSALNGKQKTLILSMCPNFGPHWMFIFSCYPECLFWFIVKESIQPLIICCNNNADNNRMFCSDNMLLI